MPSYRHLGDQLNRLRDAPPAVGSHAALGANAPRAAWWFAEGYTADGFDQYFAILNPSDTPADIRITYYLGGGQAPVVKQLIAPANARTTVSVHDGAHGVGRAQEVAAKVETTNGVLIVVERAMYFRYRFAGGDAALDPALVPPEESIFVGPGGREAFVAVGRWFLDCFVDLCLLRSDERVLDIGCGIGRMAAALTTYLGPEARYEGFDIVPEGIDWCRRAITPRFPNFRFQLADIYNSRYNPAGTLRAAEFTFPYPDAAFDFAFATSVFTHMFPRDVERYLAEVARVLRPGGRCLLTFFLLNARSLASVEGGASTLDFRNRGDGYRTTHPDRPEETIAYDERDARALIAASGLRLVEPIRFGNWSDGRAGYTYQDLIIAVR